MQAELTEIKMDLRRYFKAMGTSVELSYRALRFAEESYNMNCTLVLKTSIVGLLSESLAAEIVLSSRNRYLLIHPFFRLLSHAFGQMYITVCNSFGGVLYASGDVVFEINNNVIVE